MLHCSPYHPDLTQIFSLFFFSFSFLSMADSGDKEVAHNFPPFFKVYKDGHIERLANWPTAPAGLDPNTGVQTKDVVVSSETGVKGRLFLPKIDGSDQKLPLLVHYHGGGFCLGSAFDLSFKIFLTSLVVQTNVMAISIDYRLAPEHPLPIAHDDSWAGFEWIASHSNGLGPEAWLNEHADLGRVIVAGESAGANLAHYVAVKAGVAGPDGVNIVGTLSVHPYFALDETDEMIQYMYPTCPGFGKDPILNPEADSNLKSMQSKSMLVCVAEKDPLKNRGVNYYETLSKSEWGGSVELFESVGENHCFHFFNPTSPNVGPLMNKMVEFIKGF